MNKRLFLGLIIAAVVQIGILAAMLIKASYPLWVGTEIRVATSPIDPRSLFRGNYARLRYPLSSIPAGDLAASPLRNGDVIYVSLKENAQGLHEYADASLSQPREGIFIRGRARVRSASRERTHIPMTYGIEAFFAPKEKALALERSMAGGGIAVLKVSDTGTVALLDVVAQKPESSR